MESNLKDMVSIGHEIADILIRERCTITDVEWLINGLKETISFQPYCISVNEHNANGTPRSQMNAPMSY